MIELLELIISIISGIAIPIILFIFARKANNMSKAKIYIDTHWEYDCFLKDMDNNYASLKYNYDIKQIEYLIESGRYKLKPIYKYIKKCYKKNVVPDKEKIKNFVYELRQNHCEIYTFHTKKRTY